MDFWDIWGLCNYKEGLRQTNGIKMHRFIRSPVDSPLFACSLSLGKIRVRIPLLRKNVMPYTVVSATSVSMCAQVHGTSVGKSVNPPERNWYQCCWQLLITKLLICFSKSSDMLCKGLRDGCWSALKHNTKHVRSWHFLWEFFFSPLSFAPVPCVS